MFFLDWQAEADPLLRTTEVALHERLHTDRSTSLPSARTILANPRLKLIPFAERLIKNEVGGEVLDIGCGNGYASAWLALNRRLTKVYALEATRSAVQQLIPAVIAATGAPASIVQPTLGSFNTIPLKDHFDYIIAFGALHHSSNLLETLKRCYVALKPGGYLIAHEPTTDDFLSNHLFVEKYGAEEEFYGSTIRNGDRDDHFFRECEYKSALHFAGFDLLAFQSAAAHMSTPWQRAKTVLRKLKSPSNAKANRLKTESKLILARKPLHPLPYIPHAW